MDDKIIEYLKLLRDNIVVVKRYKRQEDWSDEIDIKSDLELNEAELLNEREYHPALFDSRMGEDELLFPNSIKTYELNGYQKDSEFEEFLISHFKKFKNVFVKNNFWNDRDTKGEITNHVRETRNDLDHLLLSARLFKDSRFNALIKIKIDISNETLRFINFSAKPFKKKKQIEHLTSLTQNQVVILFHYLKELGYIGDEMQKNIYAHHISELTGYAEEKIRQDLSHIVKNPDGTNTVEFSEIDYSVVKRTLDKVIAKIKKDSEERFPPKP